MSASLELAEAFLHAGELADAFTILSDHLNLNPADAAARRLRASIAARLPGHARHALDDLAALETLTAGDHLLRWRILADLGDHDAAFAALQAAHALDPDSRTTDHLLAELLRRGDADAALALLADQPRTWAWQVWRGDFHTLKGDDGAAVDQFGAALDDLAVLGDSPLIVVQRARLLLKRADAYSRLRLFAQAEADYAAAAVLVPDDPLIPFNRGLLAFTRGDTEAALALCRPALDAAPAALREHMRAALAAPPYAALALALTTNG